MKKKLLSLVLAGAMVASTSVSAFASTMPNVTGSDDEDKKVNVQIKGEVLGENGEKPAGNFSVTVPTTASFTVSKDSNSILSAPITIENSGTQDIDVYADKFVDLSKEEGQGITVVKESETKNNHDRTYVSLRLQGELNTAYFKTESDESKSGIYKKPTLEDADKVGTEGLKLINIQKTQSKSLTLSGVVGDNGSQITSPVSNDFTLTLRIKKATTN